MHGYRRGLQTGCVGGMACGTTEVGELTPIATACYLHDQYQREVGVWEGAFMLWCVVCVALRTCDELSALFAKSSFSPHINNNTCPGQPGGVAPCPEAKFMAFLMNALVRGRQPEGG